jgi:predicted choloylglycine hydrolase
MNDAGLCLAELEVNQSRDGAPRFDPAGVPIEMCFRRIMEECKTIDEAEKLLQGEKRSSMCNLAICDLHDAAVLEITPKTVARRKAEDGLCSCTNHFRTPQLGTAVNSRRFDTLETCRTLTTVSLSDVAKKLDAVNQGPLTVQTMVFEPATLTLHLSLGPRPASSHPLKAIELKPLLKDAPAAR